MPDAALIQHDKIAVDQTAPAPANAHALDAAAERCADNSSNGGIHARRVSAAGQDANSFDCVFHCRFLPKYLLRPIVLRTGTMGLL